MQWIRRSLERCELCADLDFLEDSCDIYADLEDLSEKISNIFNSKEGAMWCIAEQNYLKTTPFESMTNVPALKS